MSFGGGMGNIRCGWYYGAAVCSGGDSEVAGGGGIEIFIVTGRNNEDMSVDGMPKGWTWEDVTRDWLKRNGIEYDEIEFHQRGRPAPNDKGTYCAEQGLR